MGFFADIFKKPLRPLEMKIKRNVFGETYTIGQWMVDGMPLCQSLEDKDRGLEQSMSLSEIKAKKLYGKTCIPYGRYEVRLSQSPKLSSKTYSREFGGLVPELINVPGYIGIRIHPGNSSADTDGCLLPGENRTPGRLINSTLAYTDLMRYYLMPAHKRGQKMYITIEK